MGKDKTTTHKPEEGFKEPKCKRRNSTEGDRPDSAKKQSKGERTTPEPQTMTTRNFFAPLRDLEMKEAPETGCDGEETETSQRTGKNRSPSIIITAQINLLKFQGEIKAIAKGSVEIRNTKTGTRVITTGMADYLAIKNQLEKKKTPFYTFHPKSVKQIKVVIRQLPGNTLAEDIAHELIEMGFKVISV
jgi:hypothetical protein